MNKVLWAKLWGSISIGMNTMFQLGLVSNVDPRGRESADRTIADLKKNLQTLLGHVEVDTEPTVSLASERSGQIGDNGDHPMRRRNNLGRLPDFEISETDKQKAKIMLFSGDKRMVFEAAKACRIIDQDVEETDEAFEKLNGLIQILRQVAGD